MLSVGDITVSCKVTPDVIKALADEKSSTGSDMGDSTAEGESIESKSILSAGVSNCVSCCSSGGVW